MSEERTLATDAAHWADRANHVQAQRLGVLLFLASEGLLFGALFALYAAYRAHYPAGFAQGVREDLRGDGALMTVALLLGGACAASAVARLHAGRIRAAVALLRATAALGVAFLALKAWEYMVHIRDGIGLGGRGSFFAAHHTPGLEQFFDLYWLMTGLHALHVAIGIVWISAVARLARGGSREQPWVELGAMYWHFVDLVWIFLWPLFYLLGNGF